MNKYIFIKNQVRLIYKNELCIRCSTSGATNIERVTDVTKGHINEKRNAAKEGQATGKQ